MVIAVDMVGALTTRASLALSARAGTTSGNSERGETAGLGDGERWPVSSRMHEKVWWAGVIADGSVILSDDRGWQGGQAFHAALHRLMGARTSEPDKKGGPLCTFAVSRLLTSSLGRPHRCSLGRATARGDKMLVSTIRRHKYSGYLGTTVVVRSDRCLRLVGLGTISVYYQRIRTGKLH